VGEIFLAGKKSKKRAALQSTVIADSPAQHRITGLKRIQNRAHCDRRRHFECDFGTDVCKSAKMGWKNDSNHGPNTFSRQSANLSFSGRTSCRMGRKGEANSAATKGAHDVHLPPAADFVCICGSSFSTAQNFPIVFTASANWAKSTGLST